MTAQAPSTEQIRDAWEAIAPRFDEFATPETIGFGERILGRLGLDTGTRLLDVAAGSGALSLPAARLGAEVVAVDIAPAMIERLQARARTDGLTNVAGRVMDGSALEFDDDTFDVSVSQNGVSVFPDMKRGLAEMVRVTKPGGTVLVVAFGALERAEFLGFFVGAAKAAVPDFTPMPVDQPPLPFQVSDPAVFRARLAEAGLTDVTVETTTWDMPVESAMHLWNFIASGHPIGAQMIASLTREHQVETQRVLDGMLRERSGGEPGAVIHTELNVGVGTKPEGSAHDHRLSRTQ
ncbi:methyltransferase domain-containing protein [Phytoactinopolyspora alkaliphila]|uniref:Methyltransferase domain-containing protein n=1 Tax=Phytoactinopolyspora alkaliphila TaxID=1783498 RepID=A0A6N9YQK7_9ACTN|nr:methyltransferase domain-containing protein [Phytoactinopolyspora alkaliphila]NED97336.1 methyltransferase domain-containing protein [Phytoactinopolyspora alkaliphila]